MNRGPKVRHSRTVVDCKGVPLGTTSQPSPGEGSGELEVTLSDPAREVLDLDASHLCVPARWIQAVRRDQVTLEVPIHELALSARSPARPPA